MSKISELSDGGVIQGGDTLIAVRSGGNVKVTYGGTTTANIDGGTIDGTTIGGTTPAAGNFTTGSFTGNVSFGDNDKAIFGAGSDLQIYHDGTHSYVSDQGTGNLRVLAENFQVRNPANNEAMLIAIPDSGVTLYHDNSTKLATTSTGIDVTGTVTADGLTVDGATDGTAVALLRADNNSVTKKNTLRFEDTDTTTQNDQQIGRIEFYSNDTDHTGVDAVIEAVSATTALKELRFLTSETANTPLSRLSIAKNGDISFYEDTGTTAKFAWDAADETISIGLGASSTATISAFSRTVSASLPSALRIIENTGASTYWDIGANNGANPNLNFYVNANTTPKVTFASSGNVGIGETSPNSKLRVKDSDTTVATLESTGDNSFISFIDSGTGSRTHVQVGSEDNDMVFHTNDSERMRIDSSCNVKIADGDLEFTATQSNYTISVPDVAANIFNTGDRGNITIKASGSTSGSQAMSGGRVLITAGDSHNGQTGDIVLSTGANLLNASDNGVIRFNIGGTASGDEAMRIDASDNVLVGKTSTAFGTQGIVLNANGVIDVTKNGDAALFLNRLTSDGAIAIFHKAGTAVGSIGVDSGDNLYIGGSAASHGGLYFGTNTAAPLSAGTLTDDVMDLGTATYRFDDVYATNGTINTSDRNEKQDIEVLSDAEQRVAVACKGLLRKFRWKSSVAENGDDARIHFGIIAQDLQAAFEAEGLDAGRYAMFISTTWTDEETGEERTRMGVRYSELLAFIIAAI